MTTATKTTEQLTLEAIQEIGAENNGKFTIIQLKEKLGLETNSSAAARYRQLAIALSGISDPKKFSMKTFQNPAGLATLQSTKKGRTGKTEEEKAADALAKKSSLLALIAPAPNGNGKKK